MLITLAVVLLLTILIILYTRLPKFGSAPSNESRAAFSKAANFKNGKFQNIHFTPSLVEGYNLAGVAYSQFFNKNPRRRFEGIIPSVKTNLLALDRSKDVLVWFGHSSYFMQVNGKTFLVDPVFSGNASPLPGTNKAFRGTDVYGVEDLPEIDYLLITHDHYDHLDYPTVVKLRDKVKMVITGLGVRYHLERWGYDAKKIIEKNWHEKVELDAGMILHTTPARHFSGRGFTRNNTLWLSFVLQSPTKKFYLGGDSGYDTHFAEIGEKFGPFDLAILDNGQYDPAWRYIHMLPEEVLKAARDLKAKRLLPVHSSKFAMANHAWDEPLSKITALNNDDHLSLVTPMIGEVLSLDANAQVFMEWWRGLEDK